MHKRTITPKRKQFKYEMMKLKWKLVIIINGFVAISYLTGQIFLIEATNQRGNLVSSPSLKTNVVSYSKSIVLSKTKSTTTTTTKSLHNNFTENLISKTIKFDHTKHWLVFLHIQKTSGTNFDADIVSYLEYIDEKQKWRPACTTELVSIKKVRSREFECKRDEESNVSWILSWHERNFGWSCGLHPSNLFLFKFFTL